MSGNLFNEPRNFTRINYVKAEEYEEWALWRER